MYFTEFYHNACKLTNVIFKLQCKILQSERNLHKTQCPERIFALSTLYTFLFQILQPQLSQEVVKFSTPLRFSGNGRLAASFSAEARDQLIGDTTKPISEQPEKLSERLQSQLLSARL